MINSKPAIKTWRLFTKYNGAALGEVQWATKRPATQEFMVCVMTPMEYLQTNLLGLAVLLCEYPADPITDAPNELPHYWHGIIISFTLTRIGERQWKYQLKCASELKLLSLTKRCKVFSAITLREIINQIFAQFIVDLKIQFILQNPEVKIPFFVQYDESDWAALLRLLTHYGWSYTIKQEQTQAILTFYDDKRNLPLRCIQKKETSGLHGLSIAKIIQPTHAKHAISQEGYYHVAYSFAPTENFCFPLLAFYGGRSSSLKLGQHFPLQDNTQVVLGHIAGKLEHAVLLGAVCNQYAPSPAMQHNKYSHVLRTCSGNEMRFYDEEEAEYCILSTKNQNNFIKLSANQGSSQLELVSRNGSITVYADQHQHWDVGHDLKQIIKRNWQWVTQGDAHLQSQQSTLLFKTNADVKADVKCDLSFHTLQDDWVCDAKHIDWKIYKDWSCQVYNEDAQWTTKSGNIVLKANKSFTFAAKNQHPLLIKSKNDVMIHLSEQQLYLHGKTITFSAAKIVIQGSVMLKEREN